MRSKLFILLFISGVTTLAQSIEPEVHWRKIEWPEWDSETGQPVSQENSGEDWWYDHKNTYDANGVQTGFIAVGFHYGVNRLINYDIRDLDNNGTYEGCDYCDAASESHIVELFETPTIKRRCGRAIMMQFDMHGRCKWARNYNAGEFISVIQTSDGGFLALGYTSTTINAPVNIQNNYSSMAPSYINANSYLFYNPIMGQNLTHFDCQNTLATSKLPSAYDNRGSRPFLVKTDANGLIEWNYQYGGQDFYTEENAAFSQKMGSGDIVETDNGDFLIIYSTKKYNASVPDDKNNFQSYLISISEEGFVNWKIPVIGPSFELSSIAKNPTNTNKFAISGVKYYSPVQANTNEYNKSVVVAEITLNASGFSTNWSINGNVYREIGGAAQFPSAIGKGAKNTDVDYKSNGQIIFPYIDDCFPCGGAGHNRGIGKILILNSNNGSISSVLDIGPINAYDFQMACTPTSDGGFAVLSSKGKYDQQGVFIPSQYTDSDIFPNLTQGFRNVINNGGNGPSDVNNWMKYWDTDAYFVKFNSSDQQEWFKKVDATDQQREPFPGDFKKQECVYSISESSDGGYVTSGNTSHNFDDFYLLKLHGDCQKKIVDYEIPTNGTTNTIEVNSNTIWSSNKKINSRVVVSNGATLTVDGAVIEFADFRQTGNIVRIDILPGAKLILRNGAKLTSIQSCPQSVWSGIAVYGNSLLTQTFLNQGAVILEGSATQKVIIENSIDGIMTKGFHPSSLNSIDWATFGGIIQAEYANFQNNLRDVEFMRYSSFEGGKSKQNISFFKHCEFKKTSEFKEPNNFREGSVTMWDVQGVKFISCTFDNSSLNLDQQNTTCGIYSIDANYTVTWDCQNPDPVNGCFGADSSYFRGMKYGVKSEFTKGFVSDYIDIHGTEFKTLNGIYFGGAYGNRVTRSSFYVNRTDELAQTFKIPYGVYLDYNSGFTFEENKFYSSGQTTGHNVGLVVNNAGALYNSIYNNTFTNFHVGLSAQGWNNNGVVDPLKPNIGLEIRCNDFTFGHYDVYVQGNPLVAWDGIKREQGRPGDTKTLAGNSFSLSGLNQSDYLNYPHPINYHHHDINLAGNSTILKPVDVLNVNRISDFQFYSKSLSCPVGIVLGKTNGELHDQIDVAQNEIQMDQELLLQLMNATDDWQLEANILFAQTEQQWLDVYTDLMSQSPFLGHDVIETAILEPDFPDLMLRNVLLANPDSPKDSHLMNLVYNRNMANWIVQDILDGRSSYGAKEVIVGRISANIGLKHKAISELIRTFDRTSEYNGSDSIISLLSSQSELTFKYLLIDAYLAKKDYASALATLSAIQLNGYAGRDSMDLSAFNSWFTILLQIQEAQKTWFDLDSAQFNTIVALADTSNHNATMLWANAVLHLLEAESNYVEIVYIPQENSNKRDPYNNDNLLGEQVSGSLYLYPNPASHLLNIVDSDVVEGKVDLYTMDGVQLMSSPLSFGTAILDISILSQGVYLVKTTNEAGLSHVSQFIVKK